MESFLGNRKLITISAGVVILLIAALALVQVFRLFGSSSVISHISDVVVGGRLRRENISAGAHTLEFRAVARDGRTIRTNIAFTAQVASTPSPSIVTPSPTTSSSPAVTPAATTTIAPTTPPRPNALGPYVGALDIPVQFSGIARYPNNVGLPPNGFTYEWDFGDGVKGQGPIPSHKYSNTGTYTVTFTVTDPYHNSRSVTTTATIGASGSMEKPRTEYQIDSTNLLANTVYGYLDWSEMAANGAWGANAQWEQGQATSWHIELQRYGGGLVIGGVLHNNTSAIDAGFKAFEWGFNHQAADGSFAGTADPFHSTSIFVEAVSHSLLLLKQSPYASQYQPQIDLYTGKVHNAVNWMSGSTVWATGLKNNQPYTHRRYIVANALALTSKLVGGDEHLMSLSLSQISDGLSLQREDGVNPELGGYDTSYQTLGISYATKWVTYFPSEALTPAVKNMITKGLAWEATKILPTGEVDTEGSTRTGTEVGPSGTVKTVDWKRTVEAFAYWYWRSDITQRLLDGQQVAQFYYKQY